MIAAWMLYWIGMAVAFAVAGEALERALHLAGRPTRWAWVVALASSLIVPAAAWLRPQAFTALPIVLSRAVDTSVAVVSGKQLRVATQPLPAQPFSLSDLDGALGWAWGASSAALLLVFAAAGLRLTALRRRWRASTVSGRSVLLSENIGPAVAGLLAPRVVVPAWALQLGDRERQLMLAHEEEHIRAGDPWLLAAGSLMLVLAPWNPALWWQVRRLRLGIEMDCDARVLARGGEPREYGELLLHVGRCRARLPLGTPALGEPSSLLEHRIRRMVTALPRWRWVGVAVGTGVAVAVLVAACEAPRPVAVSAQEQVEGNLPFMRNNERSARAETQLWTFRDFPRANVADAVVWLVLDPTGKVLARGTLPRQAEDTVWDALRVARRIPGYDTLAVARIVLRAERDLPTISVQLHAPGAPPPISPADLQAIQERSAYVRQVARRYYPDVLGRLARPGTAIALVFDPQGRLVGHAAGVREARDGDCLAVVKRLVPEFAAGQPSQSGCAGAGQVGHPDDVVVYWMWLVRLPTSAHLGGTAPEKL